MGALNPQGDPGFRSESPWGWALRQCSQAALMQGGEQHAGGDTNGLVRIVVFDLATVGEATPFLHEDRDEPGCDSRKGLSGSVPNGASASSHSFGARCV